MKALPLFRSLTLIAACTTTFLSLFLKAAEVSSHAPADDWFGSCLEADEGWCYHAEHGWLWPELLPGGELWWFDAGLGYWLWTAEALYPWVYAMGGRNEWLFLARNRLPGDRMFFSVLAEQWTHESHLCALEPSPPRGRFVFVEGGNLVAHYPREAVFVGSFWMSAYEVTWGEWKTVAEWAARNGYDLFPGEACADDHPMHSVSWYAAAKWCNAKSEMEGLEPAYWIEGHVFRSQLPVFSPVTWKEEANGYRLPTENEWEFAARGGLHSLGFEFSGSNEESDVAWTVHNSQNPDCDLAFGRGTHPVGQKRPNELGLHDMSGNVAEWCWNEVGSSLHRSVRGGSWDDMGTKAFVHYRGSADPWFGRESLGFRLSRNP